MSQVKLPLDGGLEVQQKITWIIWLTWEYLHMAKL